MSESVHSGRSVEFLSRLHDGELSRAEAADFETHRAGCPSCRDAAVEFERSLSAFRAAPTAGVPSDLSARILRKIRAQSPSRRPFGVMFGIDTRWAGVMMAALLVAILAPALFFRREARPPTPERDAISAYIVDTAPANPPIVAADSPAPPASPRGRLPQKAPANEPKEEEKAQATRRRDDAPRKAPLAREAPPARVADEPATAPRDSRQLESAAPAAAPRRESSLPERSGGEAGAGTVAGEEFASTRVRLEILALDGNGPPPPIARSPSDDRLAALRGQEFDLLVQTDGSVRSVTREGGSARLQKDAAAADSNAAAPESPLGELRFRPGGPPRRLRIRIR